MDVIKITPEELRGMAAAFEQGAILAQNERASGCCSDESVFIEAQRCARSYAGKLHKLADKLEADKREALEFIPAKGVQA